MEEEIYKQNILDHYKNPRNKGKIKDFDLSGSARNISCGDVVSVFVKLNKGIVSQVSFEGYGCAISQAGASMLTDKIKGMKSEGLKLLSPGDMYNMLGIKVSPGRSGCALLAYQALEDGLKMSKLQIQNLKVKVGDKLVVNGVSLTINQGEIHIIMGPNGSGKSSLINAVFSHPKYSISSGKIFWIRMR